MTYEERQKFKELKQEVEHSIYKNIIDNIMRFSESYETLPSKDQLQIIMLISKIKSLDSKYSAWVCYYIMGIYICLFLGNFYYLIFF